MAITRRSFLKGVATTSAASVIGPSLLASASANAAETTGTWKVSGSHWGAFRAHIYGGKVQEIKPLEMDSHPTDMINGIKGIIYSPSRVRYPMVRLDWLKKHKYSADTRGNNRFIRVTWDEALDLFYRELERVQKDYGPWALHAGQTGWRQTGQFHSCTSHMQRAVGMHGNYITKVGDYSTGAGQTIMPYVLGSTEVYAQGTSWSEILENSDNIILWANDPVKNLQVGWNCETHESFPYLEQLKEKVAKGEINVLSVDPVKNKTQRYLQNDHMYINPMTDVAFMLAVAHVLYKEDLHDKEFIKTYCLGFDPFIQYVLGETKDKIEKTPEWAAEICGVEADKIREFARMLVSGRTQILMGWCIQRQEHGEQPYWAAAVVAAMVGQIGLPGGGISYGHHYSGIGVPSTGFAAPGGFPRNLDQGMKPKWDNKDFNGYSRTIPVARWIDCLLEPGKEIRYNGSKVKLPDYKMMVISGNNPWHHHQDRNRMKKAFRKLQTVVTIEFAWTATCRFSDIVLPACTQWERNDIDVYGSYSGRGLVAMQKLVDPLFQSRTDFDIFTELTRRFGRHKEYTRGMDEMEWVRSLYEDCRNANKAKFDMPEFDEFWEKGVLDFGTGKPWVRHADFRKDPEINALGTPSGFIEISSRTIGRMGYEHCQDHPMWFEKTERSHGGPGSEKHPYWLQSCHPDKRLHSQMCESEEFRATYAVQGREPVYINPVDAKKKGIKDGDLVRVFNDRGQLMAGAVVTDSFPQGVIRIEEGAWYGPLNEKEGAICTYGDPNTLTQDIPTSELAQATSANTCIVDFEKFSGEVPPVTSFGGPIEVI
ncbi:Trimethylamine-N-oxide reductase precursor (TMAO reductase) (Trimethylamine oxidase) [Vibrio nigripulchritudo MADA3029]|uniref:Trimethylamine-N-oxide reductase n=1 Tax=Vibrio nigripulchritudo SOn1 TaxID=1238450 RepID=A0AAV2VK83_9VIBR|nr:trimethylamine-N-oxide reductase TorA [Vibrio nigripulchritudo]CCN45620.1 Trimethylamine-N-oxide reductase precursor (TMAO reductase) (Trimethylamine oxidase) [Vibrio nigripulchritudo MADA3020]CCN53037.1 Trimethylamine-N-oxide reductase precursor (TMAO reductase) (Trimethylamine oxidase) [Vibrio nigripulchritudo MADA3021]CCN61527.1 Trimethylamine-N-oxide reductase precursor (TMAO reductase) (Trimethylamine oxidase) [Vibrio nigripulchritudo MADA3029]CCO44785.1 Trimethylamine-N-oxide reductase